MRARSKTAGMLVAGLAMAVALSGCDYIDLIRGKETCRQWSKHRLAADFTRKMDKDWANEFFPTFYKNAPTQRALTFPAANAELLQSMDAHCDAHPDATIVQAATQVMMAAARPAHAQ